MERGSTTTNTTTNAMRASAVFFTLCENDGALIYLSNDRAPVLPRWLPFYERRDDAVRTDVLLRAANGGRPMVATPVLVVPGETRTLDRIVAEAVQEAVAAQEIDAADTRKVLEDRVAELQDRLSERASQLAAMDAELSECRAKLAHVEALREHDTACLGIHKVMPLDRASSIVEAICRASIATMGVVDPPAAPEPPPSLAECLDAVRTIESRNAQEQARHKARGGSMSLSVVPDERLVAAAYTAWNYQPDSADDAPNVVAVTRGAAVVVVATPKAAEGGAS
jgi:hypothetical protein